MNSAGDGHDSRDEGDANPKVLIVCMILEDLGSGSFVQVRGGFGRAVEIDVVDDATVEVAAERNVTYQAGVVIEWEVEFETLNSREDVEETDGLTAAASSRRWDRGGDGLDRHRAIANGWMPFGPLRGGGGDALIWRVGFFRPFNCS